MRSEYDGVILGAGLAGLATAYHLIRNGRSRLLILEREARPGLGSSGRSASMLSQLSTDPATLRFLVRSARLVKTDWLARFSSPRFWLTGSHHFGSSADVAAYGPALDAARACGLKIERGGRDFAADRTPILAQSPFDETLFCPSDGVVDVDALIAALAEHARSHGIDIAMRSEPAAIRIESDAVQITLGDQTAVQADFLVNACGARAGGIPALWGAPVRPIRPMRRHMLVSQKIPSLPDLPILWNITGGIYARPSHDGRLYFSPCDEDLHAPEEPKTDARFEEELRKKITAFMPFWQNLKFEKIWAGLRNFSPSRKFWIGKDPLHPSVYWAAALGGNGITAAAAAGDLVARQITGRLTGDDTPFLAAFAPAG